MTGAEGLAAAFVGGVLTSASPCVLAAVPVAVGFVGGQAMTPRRVRCSGPSSSPVKTLSAPSKSPTEASASAL